MGSERIADQEKLMGCDKASHAGVSKIWERENEENVNTDKGLHAVLSPLSTVYMDTFNKSSASKLQL